MSNVTDMTVYSAVAAPHRLRLIWQNPRAHTFVEVGTLTDLGDNGSYVFSYRGDGLPTEFIPLAEFPDPTATYVSRALPAFFSNRVMSTRRESYQRYLSWLGVSDVPTPMEILAVTGGGRATDTFHVVDAFEERHGQRTGRFFASGIAHITSAPTLLSALEDGDELQLRNDPSNPVNPAAILLNATTGHQIGWVPDWLVDDVHSMQSTGLVQVFVDQVNLDAPDHLKLICRLVASM